MKNPHPRQGLPPLGESGILEYMKNLAITLQDEDVIFIENAIKSGRYLTESDVISFALAAFEVHEEIQKQRFVRLKAKIQLGIDQADRGEFAEFNLEDIKAQGRKRLAEITSGQNS